MTCVEYRINFFSMTGGFLQFSLERQAIRVKHLQAELKPAPCTQHALCNTQKQPMPGPPDIMHQLRREGWNGKAPPPLRVEGRCGAQLLRRLHDFLF